MMANLTNLVVLSLTSSASALQLNAVVGKHFDEDEKTPPRKELKQMHKDVLAKRVEVEALQKYHGELESAIRRAYTLAGVYWFVVQILTAILEKRENASEPEVKAAYNEEITFAKQELKELEKIVQALESGGPEVQIPDKFRGSAAALAKVVENLCDVEVTKYFQNAPWKIGVGTSVTFNQSFTSKDGQNVAVGSFGMITNIENEMCTIVLRDVNGDFGKTISGVSKTILGKALEYKDKIRNSWFHFSTLGSVILATAADLNLTERQIEEFRSTINKLYEEKPVVDISSLAHITNTANIFQLVSLQADSTIIQEYQDAMNSVSKQVEKVKAKKIKAQKKKGRTFDDSDDDDDDDDEPATTNAKCELSTSEKHSAKKQFYDKMFNSAAGKEYAATLHGHMITRLESEQQTDRALMKEAGAKNIYSKLQSKYIPSTVTEKMITILSQFQDSVDYGIRMKQYEMFVKSKDIAAKTAAPANVLRVGKQAINGRRILNVIDTNSLEKCCVCQMDVSILKIERQGTRCRCDSCAKDKTKQKQWNDLLNDPDAECPICDVRYEQRLNDATAKLASDMMAMRLSKDPVGTEMTIFPGQYHLKADGQEQIVLKAAKTSGKVVQKIEDSEVFEIQLTSGDFEGESILVSLP